MAAGDPVDQSDLKRVKGIGVKVEARLKAAGITDLGKLTRTPVNELAAILEGLRGKFDADRILHEEWPSQAAALATVPEGTAAEQGPARNVRHNFTVEVRLAIAGREIVSSKVVHVQTGDEATWAGWDRQHLAAFIEDRARARSPRSEPEVARDSPPATEPVPDPLKGDEVTGRESVVVHTFAVVRATGPAATVSGPVTAILSFDTGALALPAEPVAQAKVDIFARRPPLGKSILIGGILADISPGVPVVLEIPCQLPATGYPVAMFAAVRLFATHEAGQPRSSVLPNARMSVSGPR